MPSQSGEMPLTTTDDAPPTRGISRYLELEARIEKQLWAWEAEFGEIPVAPTDKVRTLLFFAWQELRDRDRQRTQAVVMEVDR